MAHAVSASRVVAGEQGRVFDLVMPAPLTTFFSRRHLALPPIRETTDQSGDWSTVGETRTVRLADGGSMVETLTAVDRPSSFGYTLDRFRGPMRALVRHVEGQWSFRPAEGGTEVTWSWRLHATNAVTARALPALGLMWKGYAAKALAAVDAHVREQRPGG